MTELLDAQPVGELLRDWRRRRRLSQLDLACEAGVSARHVSFLETGRARPSRDMLLHLAEHMSVPMREQNRLLLAGGYAPVFGERPLDDPAMSSVRAAVDRLLAAYEPFPALVVDRRWNLVAANAAVALLTDGVGPQLLEPPVNALRLSLSPHGMGPRIVNLAQWRHHLLHRLARDGAASGDRALLDLHAELSALPGGVDAGVPSDIAVPLQLRHGDEVLSFLSTVTTFGTAVDITTAELSIEAFLPADEATARTLHALHGNARTLHATPGAL